MAAGTVTLATLVQMLKAVTRHYAAVTFSPAEMENALNAAQGKVYVMLPKHIKQAVYGVSKDCYNPVSEDDVYYVNLADIDTTYGGDQEEDITSVLWDVVALRLHYLVTSAATSKPMFRAELDYVLTVGNNSYRQGIYWAKVGDRLYLSEEPTHADADANSAFVKIYYLLRPVDMTSVLPMDLPDEYRRYLVLMAAVDLLSFASGVPQDAITSARQEVVVEGKLLGLYAGYPDSMAGLDAKTPDKDEDPIARGGGG